MTRNEIMEKVAGILEHREMRSTNDTNVFLVLAELTTFIEITQANAYHRGFESGRNPASIGDEDI